MFKLFNRVMTEPLPAVSSLSGSDKLKQVVLKEVYGASSFGAPGRSDAMQLAAVKRGRALICGQIGAFPLAVVNKHGQRVENQLTGRLEHGRALSVTLAWIADALLFYGRAYLIVTERRAEDKRPTSFIFVPEWESDTDKQGRLLKAYGQPVDPADTVRIDFNEEGFLQTAAEDILQGINLKKAVGRAAENPVPSIELHQKSGEQLNQEEVKQLTEAWLQARRSNGVAYSSENIDVKTHGQHAEQLLIDARTANAKELAGHMNLPAWAVDAPTSGSSITYANVPSRTREIIDYTLTPYLNAIAARLSMNDILPGGQRFVFETRAALMGNFSDRMTAYKTAIDAGIYTAAECRAFEQSDTMEDYH